MHVDKDATKQKDFSEVKALLPPPFTLHVAGKCGAMLMEVSGSHHKLCWVFSCVFFLFYPIALSLSFIQLQICPQIFCVLAH